MLTLYIWNPRKKMYMCEPPLIFMNSHHSISAYFISYNTCTYNQACIGMISISVNIGVIVNCYASVGSFCIPITSTRNIICVSSILPQPYVALLTQGQLPISYMENGKLVSVFQRVPTVCCQLHSILRFMSNLFHSGW